ncbi:MAG: tyrosine-type recombinase/integrase [Rhizobiaceae bacterium]|nr:tyrosine-type recombinase/integrase [Rhizobiaceae bacterium]
MTSIRVRGVNRVTAKGRTYYYHRATGKRIEADPNDAAKFAAEVAALDAAKPPKPEGKPGELGQVIVAYKRSPKWLELKPDTQKSYQRAFDALKSLDAMPVGTMTQADVLGIQERIYRKHRRWLANMVVKALSIVLGWAVPRGIVTTNVAKGVLMIRRRTGEVANKAWTPKEADILLKRASGGLRKAIALAYFAGFRKKDCVELPRTARARGQIETTQSKTGHDLTVFEVRRLKAILDAKDKKPGSTIVVNESGKPYTRDGLDSVFDKLKRELVEEGLIRKGLTFHGLRKSLGKAAADLGLSENDIAAALGHRNPASARVYTIEAQQKAGARRVSRAMDKNRT